MRGWLPGVGVAALAAAMPGGLAGQELQVAERAIDADSVNEPPSTVGPLVANVSPGAGIQELDIAEN